MKKKEHSIYIHEKSPCNSMSKIMYDFFQSGIKYYIKIFNRSMRSLATIDLNDYHD